MSSTVLLPLALLKATGTTGTAKRFDCEYSLLQLLLRYVTMPYSMAFSRTVVGFEGLDQNANHELEPRRAGFKHHSYRAKQSRVTILSASLGRTGRFSGYSDYEEQQAL